MALLGGLEDSLRVVIAAEVRLSFALKPGGGPEGGSYFGSSS